MKEKIEPPSQRMRKFIIPQQWDSSIRIHILLYAIFGIAFYLLLMGHVLPHQYSIHIGIESPTTIVSPVTRIDRNATEEAREQAASQVEQQYTIDETKTNKQKDWIDRIIADTRKVITNPSLTEAEKIASVKKVLNEPTPKDFSDSFYLKLVRATPDQLTDIRLKTRKIVTDILGNGVRKTELEEKRAYVDSVLVTSLLDANALDPDSRLIVRELAKQSIVPNEVYDEEKTEKQKETARESVSPIPIKKGQVIVYQGEVVTKDQYRKLEELGLLKQKSHLTPQIGLVMLTLLLLSFIFFYIQRFQQDLYKNNINLVLLFSILTLTLLGMKFISFGQNLEWNALGYLAPVGFGVMLITLLLNIEIALVSVVFLAVSTSILFNVDSHLLFDFRYGLVSLVNGVSAAFALAGVRKRSSILRAGLISSVISIVPIVCLYLMIPTDGWMELVQSMMFGFGSGIFSAVLTIGFLPYFETVFGILSPLRLIELGNPNHPLLRKLLVETPGTYHHSLIVGNLAEAAAEAIGADGLLARVGAYYHDIGKTKRPQFFIENQLYRENPHDKISPQLSKTIISAHPRDGVELLKEHRIPKPIQDIAAQHHGTTLIKYFYYKALQQQKDSMQVREADFRYPGPKAQFKEAAIVGIADCVEAAVRSLSKPTPSRIENVVRKIIQDRLEDGQFNECHLTLKELDLIAISMCETLQGIFHSRIEYPEEPIVIKGVKHR